MYNAAVCWLYFQIWRLKALDSQVRESKTDSEGNCAINKDLKTRIRHVILFIATQTLFVCGVCACITHTKCDLCDKNSLWELLKSGIGWDGVTLIALGTLGVSLRSK